jgi:hypothetical protein
MSWFNASSAGISGISEATSAGVPLSTSTRPKASAFSRLRSRGQIEAARTNKRKCGNQPAHQSLLNRRLKILSPAPRNSFVLPTFRLCERRNACAQCHGQRTSEFMRDNWLSNRVFNNDNALIDHCCHTWNKLEAQPWTITSIGMRDWAHRF